MDIAYTTELHSIPNGQVTLLGAMDQVTGAMTLLEHGQQSLLIDCGMPIGREARDWLMPHQALRAGALLLTHGHTDHVSALPDLLASGFDKPIYATQPTLELTRINGRDGLRIQGASDRDIREFCERFDALKRPVPYDTTQTKIHNFDGQITWREAGHIMGSASIDIEMNDARVLCSGDLGRPDTPILRDYNTQYPTNGRPIDLVILESTYGDREHSTHGSEVEGALKKAIQHALRDGGHILVPAFAIGRTQTLIYHLNNLIESRQIRDLPVAIDSPLGLKVTELYQQSRQLFDQEAHSLLKKGDDPLEFDALYAVKKASHSAKLRDVPDPMLIIAGSGMCTGGRIIGHLAELLPRKETCVLFVGYQAKGTLGREIQDAARSGDSVTINGERVKVRCEIATISGLSAHADRNELKLWLDAVPTPKKIALHHGEADTQKKFARWLQNNNP